jgi:hypothetical protein
MSSPYEIVLGTQLEELHPRLRRYFGEIPSGSVGRGSGTFDRVGTPRRWLWPLLSLLARQGIAFPVWEKDVAFTVENRPVRARSGAVAVAAVREFHFAGGTRRMVDAITAEIPAGGRRENENGQPLGAVIVDHLGPSRRFAAELRADVRNGTLEMRSRYTRVRIGARHYRIPGAIAPSVVLVERIDQASGHQHVSVTLSLPVIGVVYEYAGSFLYSIDAAHARGVAS